MFRRDVISHRLIDGGFVELDSLHLGGRVTVRGFVFYRTKLSTKEEHECKYKDLEFVLPNCPHILVLDSRGFIHHFSYYDTRYPLHSQSLLIDPMNVEALHEHKPALPATISLKPADSNDRFLKYQGCNRSVGIWSDEKADNPYMLGLLFILKK